MVKVMDSSHLSKGLFLIKTFLKHGLSQKILSGTKYIPKYCFLFNEYMLGPEIGFRERPVRTTLLSQTPF